MCLHKQQQIKSEVTQNIMQTTVYENEAETVIYKIKSTFNIKVILRMQLFKEKKQIFLQLRSLVHCVM